MRHFYRSHLAPAQVLVAADEFFPEIGLAQVTTAPRTRAFTGPLGSMKLIVKSEGGHYTFVQADSDQAGESRLDKTVKKFFVHLHTAADPRHALEAGY